jgi:hypothetical protein
MATQKPSFKSVVDVMNAFGVGVFPSKSNPGKHTVSFTNAAGKRQFINREQMLKEDGTRVWVWTEGKELEPQAEKAPAIEVA